MKKFIVWFVSVVGVLAAIAAAGFFILRYLEKNGKSDLIPSVFKSKECGCGCCDAFDNDTELKA